MGGYGSLTYGWDAGGNRTSRAWTQGGSTTTDSATHAGASNRLLGVARGGQSRTLGHDAAGNVTTDTRFDGTAFAYGYDGDGRLATVTRNALPEATYGYDAFQRRVLETAGGVTRHFLHDPDRHLLAEATSAGVTATEWLWLGDTPLAMVADVDTASPRLFWFHTDQLDTPQKLTDSAGNLAWDAVLEPFGELAALTVNLVAQPLRFPGQYADPATGLHQNWHRDYDPSLGRYLQPDPLGIAVGSNLYLYANASPASYVDPDGRNPLLLATLAAVWGLYEWGAFAADTVATADTLLNPCETWQEKALSSGLWLLGAIGPGGGYSGLQKALSAAKITGYTKHGINQAISREGVGVSPRAILDAVRNPMSVIESSKGTIKYVGKDATVIVNREGKVVTTHARGAGGTRLPVSKPDGSP